MENASLFIDNNIPVSYIGSSLYVLQGKDWLNATNWSTEKVLNFIELN